jgi:hypothetical protein
MLPQSKKSDHCNRTAFGFDRHDAATRNSGEPDYEFPLGVLRSRVDKRSEQLREGADALLRGMGTTNK